MRPGYAVLGPDGKEAPKSSKHFYGRFIVWEVSDTVIVLEDIISELPGMKDSLMKSDKLELISH